MTKRDARKSHAIVAWLQLVRWQNLFILAGIQGFAGFLICQSNGLYLCSVILMTISLTAAGYVVNDLLDQAADSVNARRNPIALGLINPDHARRTYYILNIFGMLWAVALALQGSLYFIWIGAGIALALWWYSRQLKGIPLAGNLCVSALCALAVLMICLSSWSFTGLPAQLIWLSVFAFLVTWIRETVKDLEDMEGDQHVGYRTLPVATNPSIARWLSVSLTLCIIGCLGAMSHTMDWTGWFKWLLLFITCVLLLHFGIVRTLQARTSQEYHRISSVLKIIMLTGTLCVLF